MHEKSGNTSFDVGTYACPKTAKQVVLTEPASLTDLQWPVVVEKCDACGQRHVLRYEDVRHPPVIGYE
jgi:hypothetical protein